MKKNTLNENWILPVIEIIATIFLFVFSSILAIHYCQEMDANYIEGCTDQIVVEIENGLRYGKTIENYTGLSSILEKEANLIGEDVIICVADANGEYLMSCEGTSSFFLDLNNYNVFTEEIHDSNAELVVGHIIVYSEKSAIQRQVGKYANIAAFAMLFTLLISLVLINKTITNNPNPVKSIFRIIIITMIVNGILSTICYAIPFKKYIDSNTSGLEQYFTESLNQMEEKGILITDIADMDLVLETMKENNGWIESVSINADNSITFEENMNYLVRKMINIELAFIAAVILAILVMIEMLPVSKMIEFRKTENFNRANPEQFDMASKVLRLTNFMACTFSYICLSFAALQIKEWNQGAFGLSASMASALSISLCTLAEAVGIVICTLISKKVNKKKSMVVYTILLAAANFGCFLTSSTIVMILLRIVVGFAYSGNKQINNCVIASCYCTPEEKDRNLSESNAGIIGGVLCGLGLGSVVAGVFGYGATFLAAAIGFVLYFFICLFFIPWGIIDQDTLSADEENVLDNLKKTGQLLLSLDVWKYIIFVVTPQYFALMIIVTLIPGRVQNAGMSDNVLTYANLFNGLLGLYVGEKVGTYLTGKIGKLRTFAFCFVLTGLSIIMIDFPLPILMLLLSAGISGLIDGMGTPIATDLFLDCKPIKKADDETGLLLYYIAGTVVMSIAPIVLELCEKQFIWAIALAVIFFIFAALVRIIIGVSRDGSH